MTDNPNRAAFRLILAVSIVILAACDTSYDFRSENRPAYEDTVTPDELVNLRTQGATVLDVLLFEDFNDDPVLVPDALYRNPDDIVAWAAAMSPADGPVVVYCVRGKWVSQKAANYLSDRGFEVYSLDGGIEEWKASGRATETAR